METALANIMRVEYIHSDEHLLGVIRRFKGLRTYPAASDRGQRALHEKLLELAAKEIVVFDRRDGAAWCWQAREIGYGGRSSIG